MTPVASIVHSAPGRLRLRVPSKRGDSVYFDTAKNVMSMMEGIESVDIAPFTGSILMHHRTAVERIVEHGQSQGLFIIEEEKTAKVTTLHDSVAAGFGALNSRIKAATGSGIDLSGLAFLALVGAGIYQIARGNFAAPAWYTAFWYALGIFGRSGKGDDKSNNSQMT